MQIETGNELAKNLRALCDKAEERLWIASPFVGAWSAIRKILGRRWFDNSNISVRLLTDASNPNNFDLRTIRIFNQRGEIKSLNGLHAKIYIIDNNVLVTSANLTGTAFSKRYEVGIPLTGLQAQEAQTLYLNWWEHLAEPIPENRLSSRSHNKQRRYNEEFSGTALPLLWELPEDPGDPIEDLPSGFRDYNGFLTSYRDFAKIYANVQRLWSNRPLYFETDAFLNYLFHHAPGKPTQKYRQLSPRRLNAKEKHIEIKKYALMFEKWISEGSQGVEFQHRREDSSKIIKDLLNKNRISSITRKDIEQIANQLNCMNSLPLAKTMFLNARNNSLDIIRSAWENLLYGNSSLQNRMGSCANELYYFGRSSIHELLGFFNPDTYPIRNSNSSAGLRFFGYDVSAY
jgi:hypothetical protein